MMILALPLIPLAGAVAIAALHRRPSVLGPATVGVLLLTLAVGSWAAATQPATGWQWSPAIRIELAAEGFARVMVVLVPLIATPIAAYAAATEKVGAVRLLALMLAFVAAMLLLVVAADLLILIIAWELVGAISWALIGHDWRENDNPKSAAQAFITTRTGDLGLYLAAGISLGAVGTFAYTDIGAASRPALDIIAAGILFAAAAKSAQVPFSPWLFSAMAGPTPVSALLHSATLVAAGAYLLIRLAPVLEPVEWFLPAVTGVGLATALAGGVVAVLQTHVKRILAGSTSAQYGLMFVAVGAGSTAAAGAHLVTHAAFKSLLFLGAGIAMHAAGTGQVTGMRLGTSLRVVAALSLIGALALAAVPPLGAAWTKEQITAAAAHSSLWLAAGVFAASFLSVLYAARYQHLTYGPEDDGAARRSLHRRPGQVEVLSLAVLATVTLLLSLLWLPVARDFVEESTGGALLEGGLWELAVTLVLIAAALTLTWFLFRRGLLGSLGLPVKVQSGAADWLGLPAAARLMIVEPVLSLSQFLRRFDDMVVDAGVRGAVRIAAMFSWLFSTFGEFSVDGSVWAITRAVFDLATGSRVADDDVIDGAGVEGSARMTGAAGHFSRRLQTGMAHHYYVVMAVGLAVTIAVFAIFL